MDTLSRDTLKILRDPNVRVALDLSLDQLLRRQLNEIRVVMTDGRKVLLRRIDV